MLKKYYHFIDYCLIAFGSSLLVTPESRLLMCAIALPGFKP